MPKSKCTFNATVEELPEIEAPATPIKSRVEVGAPPPSPPPHKRAVMPVLERQCAFAPRTMDTPPCAPCKVDTSDTMSALEISVIVSCVAMVSVAVYSMGYRHALENTLSNMMFEE